MWHICAFAISVIGAHNACPFKFPYWSGLLSTRPFDNCSSSWLHDNTFWLALHIPSSKRFPQVYGIVCKSSLCRSVCVCLVQVAGSEEIQRSCSFGAMQLVSGWWFLEWVKQLVMSTETSLVKDHHDEALHEPILKHRLMKRIQIPSGKLT